MLEPGPDEKLYAPLMLGVVIDALTEQGVVLGDILAGTGLSKADLADFETRVSLNQCVQFHSNAFRLSRNPSFAYRTGLRCHVTSHGMFGFALLSSPNFRQTVHFAMKYRQLATPMVELAFHEEGGRAEWGVEPVAHPAIDAGLYRYLVEFQFGVIVALSRDVMGAGFRASRLQVTYPPLENDSADAQLFGCPVTFGQPANKLLFDADWLDRHAELGNELTYRAVVRICDQLVEEFDNRVGIVGRIRQYLMTNLMRQTGFEAVARHFDMSVRTLRRRLQDEHASYREVVDGLRRDLAIKYLRDTGMTVDDIAHSLGYSEAANFRHAFRRWTNAAPNRFRGIARAIAAEDARQRFPEQADR